MTRKNALKLARAAMQVDPRDFSLRAHRQDGGRCVLKVTRRPLREWQTGVTEPFGVGATWLDALRQLVRRANAIHRAEGRTLVQVP